MTYQPIIHEKECPSITDLEDGEMVCRFCNGWGVVWTKSCLISDITHSGYITPCPVCNSKGKIDWIENITGERH